MQRIKCLSVDDWIRIHNYIETEYGYNTLIVENNLGDIYDMIGEPINTVNITEPYLLIESNDKVTGLTTTEVIEYSKSTLRNHGTPNNELKEIIG